MIIEIKKQTTKTPKNTNKTEIHKLDAMLSKPQKDMLPQF